MLQLWKPNYAHYLILNFFLYFRILGSSLKSSCFLQVVTGCDSSAVAVWDVETGSKAIVFSNAHGSEEITSMKFDASWRRLLTGARNGTIKVMAYFIFGVR